MTPKKKDETSKPPKKVIKLTKSPKEAVKPTKSPKKAVKLKESPKKTVKPTKSPKTAVKSTKSPKEAVKPTKSPKKAVKPTKSPKKAVKPAKSPQTESTKTNKSKKAIKKSKVSKFSQSEKTDTAKILKSRKPKLPKKKINSTRGVVILKNIPHGFYEVELKKFLSQFGQVTGVRVPRSTRTGKAKGYAFVEFAYPDVAKIVAETMNNYLMYKRVVKAKYLPAEEQKPHAFKFKSFKVPLTVRRKQFLRKQSNRVLTEEQSDKEKKRLDDSVQKKLNKLKKLGINYEFQVANKESTSSQETTA